MFDLRLFPPKIKNTNYADAVSKISKPFTSEKIESALKSHLADIHYSISKTGGGSKVLEAFYLKFIISNLKLILKGLVGKDLEEIVSNLNSTVFGEDIAKAVALYNHKKNIQIFDTYFDKILIQHLSA